MNVRVSDIRLSNAARNNFTDLENLLIESNDNGTQPSALASLQIKFQIVKFWVMFTITSILFSAMSLSYNTEARAQYDREIPSCQENLQSWTMLTLTVVIVRSALLGSNAILQLRTRRLLFIRKTFRWISECLSLFGFLLFLWGTSLIWFSADCPCQASLWGYAIWWIQVIWGFVIPCTSLLLGLLCLSLIFSLIEREVQEPTPPEVKDQLDRKTWPLTPTPPASSGTCSICMVDFENGEQLIILPCAGKHFYHSECIERWLSMSRLCPNCRTNIVTLDEAAATPAVEPQHQLQLPSNSHTSRSSGRGRRTSSTPAAASAVP